LTATDQPARIRRRFRKPLAIAGAVLALLIGALWFSRQRIAIGLVDRRLAAAGVPASYRIARLSPFIQRIEDLRLGDPAHPDLVVRRIDLHWSYGLTGPVLAAVDAEGVRLAGRWRDGQLSLGTIDRLLPQSNAGGPLLPDLRATLRDTRLTLTTPAGTIAAQLTGSGNLARDYRGNARLDAPALALGGCAIDRMAARLAIRIVDRAPHLTGPVALGGAACPGAPLRIGAGTIAADVTIAASLDRARGRLTIAGLAGQSGPIGFGAAGGTIAFDGGASDVQGRADLTFASLTAPAGRTGAASLAGTFRHAPAETALSGAVKLDDLTANRAITQTIARASRSAKGTPVGPVLAGIGATVGTLLARADLSAQAAFTQAGGRRSLRIDQAVLRAPGGARAELSGSAAMEGAGWRIDGAVSGDALPNLTLSTHRARAAAPIDAVLRMEPYTAAGARLALVPLRISVAAGITRFATLATIDGPLSTGRIEGLAVPLAGRIDGSGAFRIAEGCTPIAFRSLQLAGMTLDPARFTLCGSPIVARGANGAIRIDAAATNVALSGRSGSAPLLLRTGQLRIAGAESFAAEQVEVLLGAADDDPTRLVVTRLDGRIVAVGLAGTFAEAAGSIRNVPLALSGANGRWRLENGALRLEGALGVTDRGPTARFNPLTSGDVTLALVDGRIDAAGTLRSPGRDQLVASIALHHDLASGAGGVRLDVPGLTFTRAGLQPEMLTPLTLGVVANVAGTISGAGRIDWTAQGVSSSGDFRTDRLDLAAAFGPVAGISGSIHFTDLLGLVTAPAQEARIAEINPGVIVANGVAHYRLIGNNRVAIEDARWPFAGGTLSLDPATLDFSQSTERRLTFQIAKLDAAAFIQQLDFPNIAATGTFDGRLPMIFDDTGGRIEGGTLASRGGGTLAYVGELSNAQLGTMGKLAFDALKAIRYSTLDISLDGKLDGEIVSRVRFEGVHQATGDTGIIARMIRNLPFRFNIQIRAPFRGLVGSARSYLNPALLLQPPPKAPVQPADSAPVR
jgi:hypothetical protein